MLSTFLRSECCDAPLRSTQDFAKDGELVTCAACGDLIGVVWTEDALLLAQDITPGDIYPDPNDSGKHHRIDYSKIDPTTFFPAVGEVGSILAVPVPAPAGVWTDPNDMPETLSIWNDPNDKSKGIRPIPEMVDEEMRRMLRDFEARHGGAFNRVSYYGGGEDTARTDAEEAADAFDAAYTATLRDRVREYLALVSVPQPHTSPLVKLIEPESPTEVIPVMRHRSDDDDDTHGDEDGNRQADPGPDTREEPEMGSQSGNDLDQPMPPAEPKDEPKVFANDTERIRALIRSRMEFNPWNGSAVKGLSPFVFTVA